MKLNCRRLLLVAAIAFFAGCCAGCSADQKAKRVIQQAEKTRSLSDFSELVQVLNEKELSRAMRDSCSDLAAGIAKELVEIFWKDGNGDGMAALYQMLSEEDTQQHLNTDELREVIRSLQRKRLLELRKRLRMCNVRKKFEWQKSYFSALEKAYRRTGNTELKKNIPMVIKLGSVLCGKAVPEGMLDVTDACSRCRATGFEICYGCHASGKCPLCKGSGSKISSPVPVKSGWNSDRQSGIEDRSVECPPQCSVCNGTGYLTTPCKKCVGKAYVVNRAKIIRLYEEQYLAGMEVLQKMLKADDSEDGDSENE